MRLLRVFNSAYNSISEHRVICRAEFCLGTDPCESEGFIEFMGGCKGTLPCGSLWRFFWCRNKSSRPSSSHQDDRSAGEKETNKEKERSGKIFGRETNQRPFSLTAIFLILSSDCYLAGAKLIAVMLDWMPWCCYVVSGHVHTAAKFGTWPLNSSDWLFSVLHWSSLSVLSDPSRTSSLIQVYGILHQF